MEKRPPATTALSTQTRGRTASHASTFSAAYTHTATSTQATTYSLTAVYSQTHNGDSSGVVSGYRYYNPELGRWVNRDPIREHSYWTQHTAGMSRIQKRRLLRERLEPDYGFVRNSPCDKVDPLGLTDWTNIDPSCDPYKPEVEEALNKACEIIETDKFESCLCGSWISKTERFLLTDCLRNRICASRTTTVKCESEPYAVGNQCYVDAWGKCGSGDVGGRGVGDHLVVLSLCPR